MRDVDARRFGGAVEIAGLGEFQRAAHRVDGSGILERQVVDVVGHHQEARQTAPARVVKPQKQHTRGVRYGALLRVEFVFALGVPVDVGDGGDAWVAQRSTSFTPRGIHISELRARVETSRSSG